MDDSLGDGPRAADTRLDAASDAYEPPAIAWEEPFEPVGLAVSCSHQEGNPGCFPGPLGL